MSTSKWSTSGGGTWSSVLQQGEAIKQDGRFEHQEVILTTAADGLVVPDFTNRVKAGITFNDKLIPGWQDEMDLAVLDLESDQECVLGQSWPLYARAHEIIEEPGETTEFRKYMATVVAGNNEDQLDFAASIGCALASSDFALINSEVLRQVGLKHNLSAAEMIDRVLTYGLEINAKAAELVARYWEALTATWIAEIVKARVDGRWGPYTVETLDKRIKEGATT